VQTAFGVLETVPSALKNLLGRVGASLVRMSGRYLSQVFDLKESIIALDQSFSFIKLWFHPDQLGVFSRPSNNY